MDAPTLVIATPTIRPENLPRIGEALAAGCPLFALRWEIVLDDAWAKVHRTHLMFPSTLLPPFAHVTRTDRPGQFGERHLNAILETLGPRDWFYGLADDNLPAEGFFERVRGHIDRDPVVRAIVFSTHRSVIGTLLARPEAMHPGQVDGAQVVVRRDAVRDIRFVDDWSPDGVFISQLIHGLRPDEIAYDPEFFVPYNALRGGE